MKQEIEKVIEDLKKRRMVCKRYKEHSSAGAFLYAITSLEEVLTNGTNDGSGVSKTDEATQVQSEENND